MSRHPALFPCYHSSVIFYRFTHIQTWKLCILARKLPAGFRANTGSYRVCIISPFFNSIFRQANTPFSQNRQYPAPFYLSVLYYHGNYRLLRDSILLPDNITKNSTNINIRKVHNNRFDSKKAALVGLKPDLKVSLMPSDLALNCRNLCREYYDLMDNRSAYVNKLQKQTNKRLLVSSSQLPVLGLHMLKTSIMPLSRLLMKQMSSVTSLTATSSGFSGCYFTQGMQHNICNTQR